MKVKKTLLVLLAVMLVAALAVGCGQQDSEPQTPADNSQEEPLKVGFIYVGPIGDAGWTYAHDLGAEYMKNEIGNVELVKAESVNENPTDAERVLNQMVSEGCKIIFATSYGYMDSVIKVAEQNPEVTFLHCSGFKTADNVGTYFGRIYQPRYLSGIVAGKMTETNTIGYVAAHPIPEVVRGINAFTLGVRSVNPDATVKVVWTNTWYDPAKEKDAAKSLLEAGADIIAQHQDTPGPQQAAEEAGVYGISYNSDMTAFAPNAVLTGPVWNWGPYYVETVQAVIDGTWKSEQKWYSMADGVVDLAPFASFVPEDVKQLVAEKKALIDSGEWDVFDGPIKAQDGTVKVPEGQSLSDDEKLNLDWFVEGVEGSVE
ncbi:MAG: BMP family ABC transporter substrate-binding protein [Bacillota bacterium]|jgi:basic membrane protein A